MTDNDLIYKRTARRIIDSPRSREQMLAVLEGTPPIIEIIRCWNCKHFIGLLDEKSAKKYGQEYECECGRLNKPEPDDFCSRAERKENR